MELRITGVTQRRIKQLKIVARVMKDQSMTDYVRSLIADDLNKITDPEMDRLEKKYEELFGKEDE